MQTTSSKLFHAAGLLTAASLTLVSAPLFAAANSDAFPTFDSYIKITGQAASIKGDSSAFQAHTGVSEFQDGAGIEDARYIHDLSKTTTLTIDGHALSGTEDYLLHLNLIKSEVGSVDVGYKSFRTFYDGVGGFFPHSPWTPVDKVTNKDGKAAYPGINQNMFIDRGEFWAEVKIGLPDQPEFKLRYTNGTRNGQKDSTSWGDSDNTGLPQNNTSIPGVTVANSDRKTIPSYLDINERHEILEGSVKHTVGNTTGEVTVLGDWTSKNNGRFEDRYPGEVKPVTGAVSGDWTTYSNETQLTNYDIQDTTTTGVNGTTVTTLGPKLTMRLGAGYQDVSSAFGGSRTQIAYSPVTGNGLRQWTTEPVQNLNGQSDSNIRTGKIAFDYKLTENFTVSIGTRGDDTNSGSNGTYQVVSNSATPGHSTFTNVTTADKVESSFLEEQSITPVIDLRYTGFRNLTLYSDVNHRSGTGTENVTPAYTTSNSVFNGFTNTTTVTPVAVPSVTVYHNAISENNTDYKIGCNWRVSSAVTLRAEPFYKDTDYHSKGFNQTNGGAKTHNNYELQSQYYGAKFTAIVRPLNVLTFTSSYTYQKGKMQVTGNLVAPVVQPENDSMDSTTHIIGETIDWNPIEQFYMQGNVNVVLNQIKTITINPGLYDTTGAGTNVMPGDYIVPTSQNDYLTFSVLAGAVLTKKDDLQVQFIAYRATNSTNHLAAYTEPYGSSGYENSVTIGLIHKFSAKMLGQAKVGYFNSHNQTTGGNTDFEGPLAYVSLTCGL
ncbi:MAG TPA: hypothetical protein VL357_07615 [Rariglobus sp.]|jgi:hypothetical protein|nr:hypothetical protein [Rariglobus sp.]